jgi:hypothetical protein
MTTVEKAQMRGILAAHARRAYAPNDRQLRHGMKRRVPVVVAPLALVLQFDGEHLPPRLCDPHPGSRLGVYRLYESDANKAFQHLSRESAGYQNRFGGTVLSHCGQRFEGAAPFGAERNLVHCQLARSRSFADSPNLQPLRRVI